MYKRISIFTPFLSKSMGGIQNLSYNLFDYLETYYNVFGYSGKVSDNDKKKNVFYSKYKNSQIKIGYEIFVKGYKDFSNNKSDISIALTWKLGIITYLYKKIFDIPYIIYIHGNDIYPNTKNYLEKQIIKLIFKNAKCIISNSDYTKRLATFYGEFDINVIHPGIDYKEVEYKFNYTDKNKILFSIARLEERKGIQNVIKALPDIIKKYKNIHYYIAGKGEYSIKLRNMVKSLELDNYVTFLGFISEKKKKELYKMCDLFVMPSYEVKTKGSIEGFGIVYLEANMYGKFVIAGNAGGVPDAVIDKKTGLLVDGKKPKEIYKSIILFFEEISRTDYASDCKKWAKKHDWNNIIQEVKELL